MVQKSIEPARPASLARTLFGFSAPVNRRTYVLAGISLGIAKLVLDYGAVALLSPGTWSLAAYLTPGRAVLELGGQGASPALPWVLLSILLPFTWAGASLTLRRAVNAGLAPAFGLLFFVPFLGYLFMLLLAVLEPRRQPRERGEKRLDLGERRSVFALLFSLLVAVPMVGLGTLALESYGFGLFVGTPFVMGMVSGFVHNAERPKRVTATLAHAWLAVALAGAVLLGIALEGVVCLMMAAPLGFILSGLGALLGRSLAQTGQYAVRSIALLTFALPVSAWMETGAPEGELRMVLSTIEIDAPPERVWPAVLAFPPLDAPAEWYFKAGVAYPTSATLSGEGVGAVRRCRFSTGDFVEPITHFEPPVRLAFDVTEQPAPMLELSPYADLHLPHLDSALESRRGEFRLVPLPGGRTRLEGRTWYALKMSPVFYWGWQSDLLIGAIHRRVLEHIRAQL